MRITTLFFSYLVFFCTPTHAGPAVVGFPHTVQTDLALACVNDTHVSQDTDREFILRPDSTHFRIIVETSQPITTKTENELSNYGLVELVFSNRAQMLVTPDIVKNIGGITDVVDVRWPKVPNQKSVSEGLAPMGVPAWHDAGITGSGVSVGILDTEFASWSKFGGTSLPELDATHVNWAPSTKGPGEGDHGTACAEIIHEIAPNAELYLANFGTELEYEAQLAWLGERVDIISASIGWDNQYPMDGTSVPAMAVEAQWDNGKLYIGAAGNEADQYWSGIWQDTDKDNAHDFIHGEYSNIIPININTHYKDTQTYGVLLRWIEPFGAANVDLDLNVYVAELDDPLTEVFNVGVSNKPQDGTGDPVEFVYEWVTLPANHGLFAQIIHYSGDPTGLELKIFNYPWGFWGPMEDYQVRAGSLTAPSDAEHCLAVGAVQHSDFQIASYSSEGPTDDGRDKPDVFAISHVTTDSYGPFKDDEYQPGFNGTSAATPHVAGVAALVWSNQPNPTNQSVWDVLIDSVDPDIISGGGNTSGSGLIVLGKPIDYPDDTNTDSQTETDTSTDTLGDIVEPDGNVNPDDDSNCGCHSRSGTSGGFGPLMVLLLSLAFARRSSKSIV